MPQPHMLYRFYDAADVLLYVGITMNPSQRWKNHSEEKAWWFDVATVRTQPFDSREEVLEAERQAIHSERPLHNVVYNKPEFVKIPKPPKAALPLRNEITWACDECGQKVTGDNGYIHVSYADMGRAKREAKEFKKRTTNEQGWQVLTGADLLDMPDRAEWRVHHRKCDPEPDGYDYWFDIGRADTYKKMLNWSAHLLEKNWIKDTNWSNLLYRTLNGYQA